MKKSTQKFKEPRVTTRDILLAVNKLSDDIEQRFTGVDQKFIGVDQKFIGINQRLDSIEHKVDNLEQRVGNVEGVINTQMVTKDYLDRKLIELRGVNKLTNLLQKKKVITPLEAKMVLSI